MKHIIILLLFISLSYGFTDQQVTSPTVLQGFSYDFGYSLTEDELPTRRLVIGIQDRVEISLATWQVFSPHVKVNLLNKGENRLFHNLSVSLFSGMKGVTFWDLVSHEYMFRVYGGVAFGTTKQFPSYTSLELICSPTLTYIQHDHYSDYSEFNESYEYIKGYFPIGYRLYTGKSARFFLTGGIVFIGHLESDEYGQQLRYEGAQATFGLGIHVGTRESRKRQRKSFKALQ